MEELTRLTKKRDMRYWIPHYDELSLYLMGFSFVVVLVLDPALRDLPSTLVETFHLMYFPFYVLALLFLAGLALSIYHAFTTRKKSPGQKRAMIYFAVMSNGLAGIAAAAYLFQHATGPLLIIPLWNIANTLALLLNYWGGMIDEQDVPDDHVSLVEVACGSAVVLIVFLGCRLLDVHWSLTFSICVLYASNLSAVPHQLMGLSTRSGAGPEEQ